MKSEVFEIVSVICRFNCLLQRPIQNPFKHLRMSVLRNKLTALWKTLYLRYLTGFWICLWLAIDVMMWYDEMILLDMMIACCYVEIHTIYTSWQKKVTNDRITVIIMTLKVTSCMIANVAPWCNSYHYNTNSLYRVKTLVLWKFKSFSRRVTGLQWQEFSIMAFSIMLNISNKQLIFNITTLITLRFSFIAGLTN